MHASGQRARRDVETPAQRAAGVAAAARLRLEASIEATARLAERFRVQVRDLARRQCAAAESLGAHAERVVSSVGAATAKRRLHFSETWEATWRGIRLGHDAQDAPRIL